MIYESKHPTGLDPTSQRQYSRNLEFSKKRISKKNNNKYEKKVGEKSSDPQHSSEENCLETVNNRWSQLRVDTDSELV